MIRYKLFLLNFQFLLFLFLFFLKYNADLVASTNEVETHKTAPCPTPKDIDVKTIHDYKLGKENSVMLSLSKYLKKKNSVKTQRRMLSNLGQSQVIKIEKLPNKTRFLKQMHNKFTNFFSVQTNFRKTSNGRKLEQSFIKRNLKKELQPQDNYNVKLRFVPNDSDIKTLTDIYTSILHHYNIHNAKNKRENKKRKLEERIKSQHQSFQLLDNLVIRNLLEENNEFNQVKNEKYKWEGGKQDIKQNEEQKEKANKDTERNIQFNQNNNKQFDKQADKQNNNKKNVTYLNFSSLALFSCLILFIILGFLAHKHKSSPIDYRAAWRQAFTKRQNSFVKPTIVPSIIGRSTRSNDYRPL